MNGLHNGTLMGSADCGGGHRFDFEAHSGSASEYIHLGLGRWLRGKRAVGLCL